MEELPRVQYVPIQEVDSLRIFTRVFVAGVLLGLVVLGAFAIYLNTIVKHTIEYVGTDQLGVATTVDSVTVGLLSGKLRVNGLRIANPGDYPGDFLSLGRGAIDIKIRSLLDEVIQLPEFTLENLELSLLRQRKSPSNFDMLIANLSASEKEDAEQQAENPDEQATRFDVEGVWLRNLQANIDMLPELGSAAKISLALDEIHIENLGTEREFTTQELFGALMAEILKSLTKNGGNLPEGLSKQLKGLGTLSLGLARDLDLMQIEQEAVQELEDQADKIFKKARKKLKNPFTRTRD